jgi:hypothetical protein
VASDGRALVTFASGGLDRMFGDGGVPGAAGPPDDVGHARDFSARREALTVRWLMAERTPKAIDRGG